MITWLDINPHDALSEPAALEIRMDNGGNHYFLILQGFGTVATCSSKNQAKSTANTLLDTIDKMPNLRASTPTPQKPDLYVVD